MNWKRVVALGAVLFVVQSLIGLLEGLFPLHDHLGLPGAFVGHAASLVLCSLVFAIHAWRYPDRPFRHAFLAFLAHNLAGAMLFAATYPWTGPFPLFPVLLGIAVVSLALVLGTAIGMGVAQRRARQGPGASSFRHGAPPSETPNAPSTVRDVAR